MVLVTSCSTLKISKRYEATNIAPPTGPLLWACSQNKIPETRWAHLAKTSICILRGIGNQIQHAQQHTGKYFTTHGDKFTLKSETVRIDLPQPTYVWVGDRFTISTKNLEELLRGDKKIVLTKITEANLIVFNLENFRIS